MRKLFALLMIGLWLQSCGNSGVTFTPDEPLTIYIGIGEEEVVYAALDVFGDDYRQVFGQELLFDDDPTLTVEILNKEPEEGYTIDVAGGKLYVKGNDARGAAYALMELSRMIGVSPWTWWADSPVEKRAKVTFKDGFHLEGNPSVKRRGIFINDEDWGLTPWSWQTFEPSETKGQIGPKTHEKIFELLLRLKANTFWPAMHDCSVAFYMTSGNKEMADKYGIYVGTSHCEPMVRNTNAEWRIAGEGEYNYVTNRENVLKFWEERVKMLASSDNIYTLGIRGVHDGKMQGADTVEGQLAAITNVLKDQREMIAKYVNPDVEQVSQVFIPYKEVLDVYNAGLEVPQDVTLMWCDDNYGYIRHFPTLEESAREGGNGVYYHVSYWGRPHDYLWLASTHPALVYTQMKMAYDKGAREMWILNVGDIKPAEYLTELFLDMAWDIDSIEPNEEGLNKHLHAWLTREFGKKTADELLPVMNEYYRLAYIHKPEYMGNTRTEEKDPAYNVVSDLPWTKDEILKRLEDYKTIVDKVAALSKNVPEEKAAAWYELVEYPVVASAEMNKKHLYGQLARHGEADWKFSDEAFDNIVTLTERYNSLCDGKWKLIMSYQPRFLPVFDKVEHKESGDTEVEAEEIIKLFNGKDYASYEGEQPVCYGLGYERGAVHLAKGCSVTYNLGDIDVDSLMVEVALAPNHPVEGTELRYSISVGSDEVQVVDYHSEGRNEEWKMNVLYNRAVRSTKHKVGKSVTITALDEGVVIDQIKLKTKKR